jgi:hypothetical protein
MVLNGVFWELKCGELSWCIVPSLTFIRSQFFLLDALSDMS